jgi:hypothetical protein
MIAATGSHPTMRAALAGMRMTFQFNLSRRVRVGRENRTGRQERNGDRKQQAAVNRSMVAHPENHTVPVAPDESPE